MSTTLPTHDPRSASAGPLRVDEVRASVADLEGPMVRLRRRLHAEPERSEEELATTSLIRDTLRVGGFEPRIMKGDIGLVADLDLGAPDGRFIALRSELDCVEVNDDKGVSYASSRPGLCHACGHDVHTTIITHVALLLAAEAERLRSVGATHNMRFIFQPAEELSTGARSMIHQGAIDGVDMILAVHVDPFLDAGLIGVRPGPITAACKSFRLAVRGRSGHSARPHEAVDPIPAVTALVDQFYCLCPRSMDSRYPLALTVTSIQAGSSFNAIPEYALVSGTLRAARVTDLEAVRKRMDAVVAGVAMSTGCEIELEFLHGCPATDNDMHAVELFSSSARDLLGDGSIRRLEVPSLGGEDFAFYQEMIRGAIVRLGSGAESGRHRYPLHSSRFDVDERCLVFGTQVMALTAARAAGVAE